MNVLHNNNDNESSNDNDNDNDTFIIVTLARTNIKQINTEH